MKRFNEEILESNEKAEKLVEIIKNLCAKTRSGDINWRKFTKSRLVKPCVDPEMFVCTHNGIDIFVDKTTITFKGTQELSFKLGDYGYDVRYQDQCGGWHIYSEPEDSLQCLLKITKLGYDPDFCNLCALSVAFSK